MLAESLPAGPQIVAGTVYVTIYVPGVDVERSITPVPELIVNPAVEEYVPPAVNPPPAVGTGFVPFAQTGVVYENAVPGVVVGVMVMLNVLLPAGPQAVAATEYVTVYVPGVDVERSITPVEEFIVNPAVEEYVPPLVNPPTGVGEGFEAFAQTGVVYENPVTGVVTGLIVMLVLLLPEGLQPEAATV